ncbi:unnamed protein product [Prorocentrum cordatum]|uniref:Uncharacterized protein n=1 Tax=Prorocentrum cordatum TaxID=2364126 RepID=A0ABN9UBF3_9DINO|nr:unnamed protein product [Polarella glacialis]
MSSRRGAKPPRLTPGALAAHAAAHTPAQKTITKVSTAPSASKAVSLAGASTAAGDGATRRRGPNKKVSCSRNACKEVMLSGKAACAECHATFAWGNFDGEGALEEVIQKCNTEPSSDQLFSKVNTIRIQKHLGEKTMETEQVVGQESHKLRIIETWDGHLKSTIESESGKSFKELKLTQTLLPSADLRAAHPGALTKVKGVRYELVKEHIVSKDTFNMLHSSQMRKQQGANAFKRAKQQWTSAFVRRLRNTTITKLDLGGDDVPPDDGDGGPADDDLDAEGEEGEEEDDPDAADPCIDEAAGNPAPTLAAPSAAGAAASSAPRYPQPSPPRSIKAASAVGASVRSPAPKRSPSGGMSVLQRVPQDGKYEYYGVTWGTNDAEEKAALEKLVKCDPIEALMDQCTKASERWARELHKKRADADPSDSIATHIQKHFALMARCRAVSLNSLPCYGNREERIQDIEAVVKAKVEFPIEWQVAVAFRALEDITQSSSMLAHIKEAMVIASFVPADFSATFEFDPLQPEMHAIVGSPDEVVSRWRGAFSRILKALVRLAEGKPNSQAVAAAIQLEDILTDLDVDSDPSYHSCLQESLKPLRCLICVFDCSHLEFYDDVADTLRAAKAGGLAVNDTRRAVIDAMDKLPACTAKLEEIKKSSRAAQQHSERIMTMCEAIVDETKTHPPQQLHKWLDMLMKAKIEIGIPDATAHAFNTFGTALERHLSEGSVRHILSGDVGCIAVAGQLMEFLRAACPHFPGHSGVITKAMELGSAFLEQASKTAIADAAADAFGNLSRASQGEVEFKPIIDQTAAAINDFVNSQLTINDDQASDAVRGIKCLNDARLAHYHMYSPAFMGNLSALAVSLKSMVLDQAECRAADAFEDLWAKLSAVSAAKQSWMQLGGAVEARIAADVGLGAILDVLSATVALEKAVNAVGSNSVADIGKVAAVTCDSSDRELQLALASSKLENIGQGVDDGTDWARDLSDKTIEEVKAVGKTDFLAEFKALELEAAIGTVEGALTSAKALCEKFGREPNADLVSRANRALLIGKKTRWEGLILLELVAMDAQSNDSAERGTTVANIRKFKRLAEKDGVFKNMLPQIVEAVSSAESSKKSVVVVTTTEAADGDPADPFSPPDDAAEPAPAVPPRPAEVLGSAPPPAPQEWGGAAAAPPPPQAEALESSLSALLGSALAQSPVELEDPAPAPPPPALFEAASDGLDPEAALSAPAAGGLPAAADDLEVADLEGKEKDGTGGVLQSGTTP